MSRKRNLNDDKILKVDEDLKTIFVTNDIVELKKKTIVLLDSLKAMDQKTVLCIRNVKGSDGYKIEDFIKASKFIYETMKNYDAFGIDDVETKLLRFRNLHRANEIKAMWVDGLATMNDLVNMLTVIRDAMITPFASLKKPSKVTLDIIPNISSLIDIVDKSPEDISSKMMIRNLNYRASIYFNPMPWKKILKFVDLCSRYAFYNSSFEISFPVYISAFRNFTWKKVANPSTDCIIITQDEKDKRVFLTLDNTNLEPKDLLNQKEGIKFVMKIGEDFYDMVPYQPEKPKQDEVIEVEGSVKIPMRVV